MDTYQDKENVKTKRSSRIPLPLPPLPALPDHLLKKLSERRPLNSLAGPNGHNLKVHSQQVHDSNTQVIAGPSNSRSQKNITRSKSPFRFVTVRRGCEVPDDNFVTYQDEKRRTSEPSVICVSSDDEHDFNENETCFVDEDGLASKRRLSAGTPALNTPARVKNIKRSLRRPHTRELQGITPLGNREKGDDRAKRRLSFNETLREQMQSPDVLQRSYTAMMDRDYASKIFSHLLQAETKSESFPRVNSETRAYVINWQMKINGVDGNAATIQTAVWYLDAELASGNMTLTPENIQLVAAASYWIAAKIHGPLMPPSKLVKYSKHAFTVQRLLEAEKVILVRMKFPRKPVIPQDYLCYFAWWCSKELADEIEGVATFICLCGMMVDKSLCPLYPSVVAAASIRNALLLVKRELIPRLQECPAYVAAEEKGGNLPYACTMLRRAVNVVTAKGYSYKFMYGQYGVCRRSDLPKQS